MTMAESQAGCTSSYRRSVKCFDEHGFAIFEDPDPDTERCHAYEKIPLSEYDLEAWKQLFSNWEKYKDRTNGKLKSLVTMGVPAKFRASLWCKLLDIETLQSQSNFYYQLNVKIVREQLVDVGISEYGGRESLTVLCEAEEDDQIEAARLNPSSHKLSPGSSRIDLACLRQIMLDIDRTYPTHKMFMGETAEGKEGRAALFRVLAVYARYNPTNGYCQGMSYLAGLLLMTMGEVEAFWCLVSLLDKNTYMAGYYDVSLQRIQTHAAIFERLLSQRLPKVCTLLKGFGLEALMYVTPWFLCMYTSLPCWDSVLAVWDAIMLEGYTALFRVAMAILDLYQFDLLKVEDLATLLPMILHLPHHVVQRKVLMPIVWETTVESAEVEKLLVMFREEAGGANVLKRKQEWSSSPSVFEFTGSPSRRKKRRIDTEVKQPENKAKDMFRKFVNLISSSHGRQNNEEKSNNENHGHSSALFTVGNGNKNKTLTANIARKYASQAQSLMKRTSVGKAPESSTRTQDIAARRSPRLVTRPALRPINKLADSQLVSRNIGSQQAHQSSKYARLSKKYS